MPDRKISPPLLIMPTSLSSHFMILANGRLIYPHLDHGVPPSATGAPTRLCLPSPLPTCTSNENMVLMIHSYLITLSCFSMTSIICYAELSAGFGTKIMLSIVHRVSTCLDLVDLSGPGSTTLSGLIFRQWFRYDKPGS